MMTELERLRREAGLSQTELSERSGVGLSSIVKLEAGRDIRPDVARRLAAFFSVSWPSLYPDGRCHYNTARQAPDDRPA